VTTFRVLPPTQIISEILGHCQPRQLAMLSGTCKWFRSVGMIEQTSKKRLQEIPRAKGLEPDFK